MLLIPVTKKSRSISKRGYYASGAFEGVRLFPRYSVILSVYYNLRNLYLSSRGKRSDSKEWGPVFLIKMIQPHNYQLVTDAVARDLNFNKIFRVTAERAPMLRFYFAWKYACMQTIEIVRFLSSLGNFARWSRNS